MLRTGARGRHAAILRELEIPVPFDLGGTADADYIYYEAGTSLFHAIHIALHEIAHMLLGHQHTSAWNQLIGLLAPDVDQALIQLILGRSAYTSAEERDAETLASLILSNATRHRNEAA
jgi:hypothetical protein